MIFRTGILCYLYQYTKEKMLAEEIYDHLRGAGQQNTGLK
jgi:hypothetical protein